MRTTVYICQKYFFEFKCTWGVYLNVGSIRARFTVFRFTYIDVRKRKKYININLLDGYDFHDTNLKIQNFYKVVEKTFYSFYFVSQEGIEKSSND